MMSQVLQNIDCSNFLAYDGNRQLYELFFVLWLMASNGINQMSRTEQIRTYLWSAQTRYRLLFSKYIHTYISHALVGIKIVDHSYVVGALPVGAARTTSSFATKHLASIN